MSAKLGKVVFFSVAFLCGTFLMWAFGSKPSTSTVHYPLGFPIDLPPNNPSTATDEVVDPIITTEIHAQPSTRIIQDIVTDSSSPSPLSPPPLTPEDDVQLASSVPDVANAFRPLSPLPVVKVTKSPTAEPLFIDKVEINVANFPISIDLPTFHRQSSTCIIDHVERTPLVPTKFLTSVRIYKGMGLSNILMDTASMFAFGGMSNRAVYFPQDSPVDVENNLLDLTLTEQCLAGVNVRILRRAHALELINGTKQLLVRKEYDHRALQPKHAYGIVKEFMKILKKDVRSVVFGKFLLQHPFYTSRPLDMCYYLRRMIFTKQIRQEAADIVARMQASGVKRFVAVHLRLESDSLMLHNWRKVHHTQLAQFWRDNINPLVLSLNADAVYICAGALEEDYANAVLSTSVVPIHFKNNKNHEDNNATSVTSHTGAAVDLLVTDAAAAVISTPPSTFSFAMMSRRCPSPQKPLSLEWFRNTSLFEWNRSIASVSVPPDNTTTQGGVGGIFTYRVKLKTPENIAVMSTLSRVRCNDPTRAFHC